MTELVPVTYNTWGSSVASEYFWMLSRIHSKSSFNCFNLLLSMLVEVSCDKECFLSFLAEKVFAEMDVVICSVYGIV